MTHTTAGSGSANRYDMSRSRKPFIIIRLWLLPGASVVVGFLLASDVTLLSLSCVMALLGGWLATYSP